MRELKGGIGECGVYIRCRENYHQEVKIGRIIGIATPICEKYGLNVPDFKILPTAKYRCGCYYYSRQLITLNIPIKFGILLHELAHHITRMKYGRGTAAHGSEFKTVLNKLFEEYNV
jgi:hypothetical protein